MPFSALHIIITRIKVCMNVVDIIEISMFTKYMEKMLLHIYLTVFLKINNLVYHELYH